MSADGMVIAITAPAVNITDNSVLATGTVSVYGLNSTTAEWEQLGAIIDTQNIHSYVVKTTVAMSADGTTIVVGAPTVGKYNEFGLVVVYKYSSVTKQWQQVGHAMTGSIYERNSIHDDAFFGSDVAISADGKIIAISSTTNSYLYLNVQVFQYSMTNKAWDRIGNKIVDVDVDIGVEGYSISMTADGRTVAIGSGGSSYTDAATGRYKLKAGRTRVFTYDTDDWVQVGSDIRGESGNDHSGSSVALSSDGRILAIGAPHNDGDGIGYYRDSRGHVRVFEFQPYKAVAATNSTIQCTFGWNLYNSITDTLVAPLTNGIVIPNPPPCNRTNIEAVIQCNQKLSTTNMTTVVLELYNANGTKLLHRRNERAVKYFLYGNKRDNIQNGRIPAGTYMIRASLNVTTGTTGNNVKMMMMSPMTKFTLGGICV